MPAIEFGPTEVPTYNRVPVVFRYLRDEELVTEKFQVLDKGMDVNVANRLLQRSQGGDAEAFNGLIVLVSKYMDNRDGTPANWAPVALPPKKADEPDAPPRFRGPDGRIHPWSAADGFLAQAAGSSRRRWLHLMNEDDEAAVENTTLTKLLEFLMELAGKDRTRA